MVDDNVPGDNTSNDNALTNSTLDDKKYIALEFIKLGFDRYKALLQVGCTDEEITILDNDVDFGRSIDYHLRAKERELLEQLDSANEIAASKGNVSGIIWRLERLDARWQSKATIQQGAQSKVEIYLPDDGRNKLIGENKEDN